jgi:hypothetical protein
MNKFKKESVNLMIQTAKMVLCMMNGSNYNTYLFMLYILYNGR